MRKRVLLGGVALGALAALWPRRARARQTAVEPREPRVDPGAGGRGVVGGWRAYYARNPLAALAVLWRLTRGELGLPAGTALRAAYAALRAQIAYAGARGRAERARPWLARFYALSPRRDGITPEALADAELAYWVAHRAVVRQPDDTPLVDALAELHALLFGGTPAAQRPSARERALACAAVDRITGRVSTDVAHDWLLAEAHLTRGYQLAVAVGQDHARSAVA
jgi:hypothetical protein